MFDRRMINALFLLVGLSALVTAAPFPADGPVVLSADPATAGDLRARIEAAGGRGCVVHLAPGRYALAGWSLGPGGPVEVVGTRQPAWSPVDANTVLVGPITMRGRDVRLTDLVLDAPAGEKVNKSAVDTLVTIEKASRVTVERCLFTGSAETALRLEHCGQWDVSTCLFDDIYRDLFALGGKGGRVVNCTMIDDRLGHGTNSLSTGRIEIRDADHLVLFNNALCPRDPDGKVLLLDGCGDDVRSDHNLWHGVIAHQYGTAQESTWQNNFRTLDSWQAHAKQMWGTTADAESHWEPVAYRRAPGAIPGPDGRGVDQRAGAGGGAATFAGTSAPVVDFFGRPADGSVGCFDLTRGGPPDRVASRSFEIDLPAAGRVSVAIYSGDRQLRTVVGGRLLSKGKHRLDWDGLDNAGKPVRLATGEKLAWRAVTAPEGPLALDVAAVGIKLADGCTGTTLANNPQENGEGIWCDAAGNLYEVAPYDEAGSTILSVDPAGHYRWRNWEHTGTLVTGDDKYIYVIGDEKAGKDDVWLERFPLAGHDPVPWGDGKVAVSLGKVSELTPTGLAYGGGTLFVSDGPRDRVVAYLLGSGVAERHISVLRPAGLIARADGLLVVCSRLGDARRLAGLGAVSLIDPAGRVVRRSDAETFSDPVDVAPGPGGTVWVADGGEGTSQQVVQWQPNGDVADVLHAVVGGAVADARLGEHGGYGRASALGPVVNEDRNLRLTHLAASDHAIWSGQKESGYARHRLVRYDLRRGYSPSVGSETFSLEGQNGSFADPHDPSLIYSPDFFRYHVDLSTGLWKWDRNYDRARRSTAGEQVGCSTGSIFYLGGRKFMATTVCNTDTANSGTVVVCRFDGEDAVPCVAVGGQFFGQAFGRKNLDLSKSGQWSWNDGNGDGRLTIQNVKLTQAGKDKDGKPFADCSWGTYVERDGTIVWPGRSAHYLRPRGLDSTGTMPVYNWSDAATIPYLDFDDRDEAYECRVDTDGSIYDLSTTKTDPMPTGYWGMGTVLTKLTPAGRRVWSVPIDMTAKGLAFDDNYVYVGSCFGPYISQYTKDGLLGRTFSWGKTDSQFGWFDFPTPINSVTDPKTGDSIVTAEEQWMGRIVVFRVPKELGRLSGDLPG